MILASFDTLLALKWLWTAAATVGVLVTGSLLIAAINDRRFLIRNNINSWRRQIAGTSIYIYFGGFGTQVIYLIVGIISLTVTTKLPDDYHVPLRSYVSTGLFIFGAICSTILAIVIYVRRRTIIDKIEAHIKSEVESHAASMEGGH